MSLGVPLASVPLARDWHAEEKTAHWLRAARCSTTRLGMANWDVRVYGSRPDLYFLYFNT
jgi:hypothetical protein